MGTVWLRLSPVQKDIQSFVNALFFGSAFLSFMAVAYEGANGLYEPLAFVVSNFLIGLLFLFLISILFASVTYGLVGFRSDAIAFFIHVIWLFQDLVAAESLIVLVASLLPNFIVALTLVAFVNARLNVFWRYAFHYIDYQSYVFRGMMVNEFTGRVYQCAGDIGFGCSCAYESDLSDQCKIDGRAVLGYYSYATNRLDTSIGIMIGIVAVYRLLGYLALRFRK
ncbi:ABC-2 type transporter [Aureobasidium namibiae CBS 147.97]|uniref:ABC-2 type transporter n=1 Tax=Aureobasidium namibiae CBS 147.97 TaxID=1043004 RepID=A0A074WYM7_9PEZI|nr:ABC-2 type transporter [Aureobasidium namibiae CBS 147.97]KEQ78288.1 ABC-2 type transporter [Aureobasidium namibiae CBS 147.97]